MGCAEASNNAIPVVDRVIVREIEWRVLDAAAYR